MSSVHVRNAGGMMGRVGGVGVLLFSSIVKHRQTVPVRRPAPRVPTRRPVVGDRGVEGKRPLRSPCALIIRWLAVHALHTTRPVIGLRNRFRDWFRVRTRAAAPGGSANWRFMTSGPCAARKRRLAAPPETRRGAKGVRIGRPDVIVTIVARVIRFVFQS